MGEKGHVKKRKTSDINIVDAALPDFTIPNGKGLNYVLEYLYSNTDGAYVRLDGTSPLTANWDAGSYLITSNSFDSTIDSTIHGLTLGRGAGTSDDSTALGIGVLSQNTNGYGNVGLGYNSLFHNSTGTYNVSVGAYSMENNTTGETNVAVGVATLDSNTEGSNNVAIGFLAMLNNTVGSENTAIGIYSSQNNTTGNDNTSIGSSSLQNNTIGQANTAIGRNAMFQNVVGYGNTVIGGASFYENIDGIQNVAIGVGAGRFLADAFTPNTSSNNSLYIGTSTASLTNADNYSIVIGTDAISMGSDTTVIGRANNTSDAYLRGNHHIDDERSIIYHLGGELGYINLPSITDTRNWNLPDTDGYIAVIDNNVVADTPTPTKYVSITIAGTAYKLLLSDFVF